MNNLNGLNYVNIFASWHQYFGISWDAILNFVKTQFSPSDLRGGLLLYKANPCESQIQTAKQTVLELMNQKSKNEQTKVCESSKENEIESTNIRQLEQKPLGRMAGNTNESYSNEHFL